MLPEVSLGLWQNFGDTKPLEDQRAILRRAFDLRVTHVDLRPEGHPLRPSQQLRSRRSKTSAENSADLGRFEV